MTKQNLETGLSSIKQLSIDLNVPIVADLFEDAAAEAIKQKLAIMRDLPPGLHDWVTYWLVVLDCDTIAMGLVGFKGVPASDGAVEIGYGIDSIYQGLGYTTEAVEALTDWAFNHPECSQIIAFTLPENIASRKVLVKNGFQEIDNTGQEIQYCKRRN